MKKKYYTFADKLDQHKSDTLRKKIWYLSDYLHDFSLKYDENNLCCGIEYLIDPKYEEPFLTYLQFIIHHDILGLKNISLPTLWENQTEKKACAAKELKSLIDDQYIHFHGEGQISINKELVDLFNLFDCIAGEISRHVFLAEEFRFPTLLKTETLKKAGYFNSFPNLWMSVYRLRNDYSVFLNIEKSGGEIDTISFDKSAYFMPYSLPPTMCYYIYDMFSNSIINGNKSVTAMGKSFRFENKYSSEYGRLWDFSIRETVFMGNSKYVTSHLERYRAIFCSVLEMIGLGGFCEYANDPFFMTQNNYMRINIQKMKKVKAEIRLNIEDNNTLAIASFNTHGQFIAKSFKLYADETKTSFVYTGCIGVGLERFVLAFLSQFGHDNRAWPSIIRDNYKDISKSKVRSVFLDPILTNIEKGKNND